jgi:hypothetical protein
MRLHHNVVKTAVRTISLAYSKITFADIAKKLLLDSPDDAEFIVAKVRFFRVSLKVVKGIFDTVPDRNFTRNPLCFCKRSLRFYPRSEFFPPGSRIQGQTDLRSSSKNAEFIVAKVRFRGGEGHKDMSSVLADQ